MSIRSLISAGALITVGMLTGRVLGLLREMLLASHFGVGHQADMAIALLLIPDFITGALIGSAASAALIPAFAARDHAQGLMLFWQALLAIVLVFVVVALLVFVGGEYGSEVLSGNMAFTPPLAFFLALCSLPLTAGASIITSYLQFRHRFLMPAFGSAIFNSIIILVLWLLPSGLILLACGIIVAALARLLAHSMAFRRAAQPLSRPSWQPWQLGGPLLKAYGATASNGIFSLLPQYVPYAVIALADSGVALFNYAFKLSVTPLMLGQTVVQMVLLPWFVRLRQIANAELLRHTYSVALQLAWVISLVICLALTMASQSVAQLCFGYGKMTPEHIVEVGQLFSIGVWAMPGMIVTSVWQQILYAHEHTRAPFVASVLQALLIAPLCWLGRDAAGLYGVLAAYAILQLLPVVLLARQGYKHGIIQQRLPSAVYAQITLAALVVFIPLAAVARYAVLPAWAEVILAALVGGISLLAGMAACLPVRQWMWQKIRRAA